MTIFADADTYPSTFDLGLWPCQMGNADNDCWSCTSSVLTLTIFHSWWWWCFPTLILTLILTYEYLICYDLESWLCQMAADAFWLMPILILPLLTLTVDRVPNGAESWAWQPGWCRRCPTHFLAHGKFGATCPTHWTLDAKTCHIGGGPFLRSDDFWF